MSTVMVAVSINDSESHLLAAIRIYWYLDGSH